MIGNRLEKFDIRLGNNFTTDFNPMNWELCVSHDDIFPAASIKHLDCQQPIRARYLTIVLPRAQYLTLCEVWIYGDRGKS